MSDKILLSIYDFLKNYIDPQNNKPFDNNNPNIQIIEKNGNVNISLSVSNDTLNKYQEIGSGTFFPYQTKSVV